MNCLNYRILYPNVNFNHHVAVQTRFGDYDAFRHVNNNAYVAYFDLGKSHFFNCLTGAECSPEQLSVAIVNINVDFLEPSLIGEHLEVRSAVVKIGERSFTLYQRIVNPVTEHVKAQAVSVLAGFDTATQQSAPLKPALTERLKEMLAQALAEQP